MRDFFNDSVLACGTCGTHVNQKKCTPDICCPREDCDGKIGLYHPLMLLAVVEFNSTGIFTNDAYVCADADEVTIRVEFRDDYGRHFPTLKGGFEYDVQPDPDNHRADFPIEIHKTIYCKNLSDFALLHEVVCSLMDLYDWAKLIR